MNYYNTSITNKPLLSADKYGGLESLFKRPSPGVPFAQMPSSSMIGGKAREAINNSMASQYGAEQKKNLNDWQRQYSTVNNQFQDAAEQAQVQSGLRGMQYTNQQQQLAQQGQAQQMSLMQAILGMLMPYSG